MIRCPVCGADELSIKPYETGPPPDGLQLTPPYEDLLGKVSYEVCPNCGFEFGNDDNPGTAAPTPFEQYHADWIARGKTPLRGVTRADHGRSEWVSVTPPATPCRG